MNYKKTLNDDSRIDSPELPIEHVYLMMLSLLAKLVDLFFSNLIQFLFLDWIMLVIWFNPDFYFEAFYSFNVYLLFLVMKMLWDKLQFDPRFQLGSKLQKTAVFHEVLFSSGKKYVFWIFIVVLNVMAWFFYIFFVILMFMPFIFAGFYVAYNLVLLVFIVFVVRSWGKTRLVFDRVVYHGHNVSTRIVFTPPSFRYYVFNVRRMLKNDSSCKGDYSNWVWQTIRMQTNLVNSCVIPFESLINVTYVVSEDKVCRVEIQGKSLITANAMFRVLNIIVVSIVLFLTKIFVSWYHGVTMTFNSPSLLFIVLFSFLLVILSLILIGVVSWVAEHKGFSWQKLHVTERVVLREGSTLPFADIRVLRIQEKKCTESHFSS